MDKKVMQLVAVVERQVEGTKKNFWTKIGVAFENKDGSYNLRFDYVPTRMAETTIQLRAFDPKEESPAAQ